MSENKYHPKQVHSELNDEFYITHLQHYNGKRTVRISHNDTGLIVTRDSYVYSFLDLEHIAKQEMHKKVNTFKKMIGNDGFIIS